MAIPSPTSVSQDPCTTQLKNPSILGSKLKLGGSEKTHFRSLTNFKNSLGLTLKASREPPSPTREVFNGKAKKIVQTEKELDLFENMKHRFLNFKRHKYMENLEHYENLSRAQAPKFLVIACADSRVCPSTILGFQPGEAFMVRNIANLVPPFEKGPSETNAALEFSVNTLEVENILVNGHSCCGGIRALMSIPDLQDEENLSNSFIRSWVITGKNARLSTNASASGLSFDQQCKHCEKESINRSLQNLLTYSWIREKVEKGVLSIHGGYYDFVDCTFEKWTLDYKASSFNNRNGRFAVKDQLFWS